MSTAQVLAGLLALAVGLVIVTQPLGRPRPDLARRLHAMSAAGWAERDRREGQAPTFSVPLLERTLRPLLDDAGELLGSLLARLGVEAGDLERRLALVMPGITPAQFRGQQLATGLVAAAIFPVFNLVGLHPAGPWPLWLWLVAFAPGFAAPSWQLGSRLRRRRLLVAQQTPVALDLVALGASAGLSPEQALAVVAGELEGVLGDELRTVVQQASVGGPGYVAGLQALGDREDVPDLMAFADAWQAAYEHGTPLAAPVQALARAARDRERTQMVEAGGRAAVKMLIPIALFILPPFVVVLLFPAGVQMLGLAR